MSQSRLIKDAKLVGKGKLPAQHQGSLSEQLNDLFTLAILFGLYDAADHIRHQVLGQKKFADRP